MARRSSGSYNLWVLILFVFLLLSLYITVYFTRICIFFSSCWFLGFCMFLFVPLLFCVWFCCFFFGKALEMKELNCFATLLCMRRMILVFNFRICFLVSGSGRSSFFLLLIVVLLGIIWRRWEESNSLNINDKGMWLIRLIRVGIR